MQRTKCSGNRIRSVTYEKQAVQRSENIRNSLGSNYKFSDDGDLDKRQRASRDGEEDRERGASRLRS